MFCCRAEQIIFLFLLKFPMQNKWSKIKFFAKNVECGGDLKIIIINFTFVRLKSFKKSFISFINTLDKNLIQIQMECECVLQIFLERSLIL